MAETGVVDRRVERRCGLGVVEQEIAAALLGRRRRAAEAAATAPARTADALLEMLAAVPEIEKGVVLRVDVDPDGEGGPGAQCEASAFLPKARRSM
jgi:hypothetical protein